MGTRSLIDWVIDVAEYFNTWEPENVDDIKQLIETAEEFGKFMTRDALAEYYARMITYRESEWDLEVNVHVGDA